MASTDAKAIPVKNVALRITFPILDADGDLVTGATSPDSEISKDGGTFADCTNEATEIATASGMYYLDLTSTEMNADTVAIIVKSGTGKTTPIVMYTAARNINDLAFPTTTGRSIDVTTGGNVGIDWANVEAPTTTLGLTNTTVGIVTTLTGHTAQTGDAYARLGAPAGASVSADIAAIEAQTDDIGTAGAGLTAVPWNAAWDAEVQSEVADALAVYDPPTKAELDTAVSPLALEATAQSILTDTAEIGAAGAGLTALGDTRIANLDAAITTRATPAQVATELATYDGPTNAEMVARTLATADYATAANLATVDTVADGIKLVTDKLSGLALTNGTIGSTGNSTTALHLDGLTYGDDEITGHYLAILDVSTGEIHVREITDWVLSTELATVATLPFTPQNAVDTYWILSATAAAGGTPPTAAAIADAVWDEAQADHVAVGSFGIVASEVADILVDTSTTLQAELDGIQADTEDLQTKVGTPAGASVSADLAAVKAETATILADTNELQGDWVNGGRLDLILDARASQTSVDDLPTNAELATSQAAADDAVLAAIAALNNLSSAQAQTAAAAALTAYDPPTHAELTAGLAAADDAVLAAIAALNNLSSAQLAAAIALGDDATLAALALVATDVDAVLALLDDARTEPGTGAPPVNPDLATKIDYLYKAWRNKKTQTTAAFTLFADDGATAHQAATVSDDGTTTTVGEMGAP